MKKATTKKTTVQKAAADSSFKGRSTITTSKNAKSSKSSRSTRSSKVSDTSEKTEKISFWQKLPNEVRLIILLFVSIALFLSIYFESFGPLGSFIKGFLSTHLGSVSYAIPFFILTATIHMFLKKTLSPHKHRYLFVALALLFLGAIHTLSNPDLYDVNNSDFLSLYETHKIGGKAFASGGTIGALIALPLKALVYDVGAYIILIFLTLICFVTATGTEPITKFFNFVASRTTDFVNKVKEERDAITEDKDSSHGGEATLPPRKRKIAKQAPQKADQQESNSVEKNDADESEFRINLYDDKKDKVAPEEKSVKPKKPFGKKEITDVVSDAETTEIPEEIKKAAMEASGGVEETKEDITPIAITDDEIDTDYIEYTFPPVDLLMKNKISAGSQDKPEDLRSQAKKLIDTLQSFGVEAKVLEVSKGPSVTRFEIQPSVGVKVSKIVNLADDIALNLAAFGVRIEAPIPGKAAVGIEIPNKSTSMVCLRDVIDSEEFRSFKSKTAFAMGKDISGQPIVSDISKMPHMLIAGATGSGKSVCINSLITSILYKADPNQVKLILIDPKVVELGVYNGIPHLLIPVVTDPRRAAGALNWAVQEMVKRYSMFATANVRDIKGYNEYAALNKERELEQIIIVIDELADLMMVAPHDVEDAICRLAQMARAAGMHLVIATQRPSVDVITGLIKANVPSRIAFSVSSQIDSRTILDMGGAEKLLGKGDMLFLPMGASKPQRLQGAFVSDKEIENIVEFIKSDSSAHYNEDIIEHIENGAEDHQSSDDSDADDLLPQAIEIVVEIGQASASLLQRKLKVGYSRAGRLIDQLEERGIIGPHEGSKPRRVLMSKNEFQEMMVNNLDE